MNKTELVKDVARRLDISVKDADNAVVEILGAIQNGVLKECEVKVGGFGTFKIVTRKARECRNPATGNPIHVPEKNVVKFKPYF